MPLYQAVKTSFKPWCGAKKKTKTAVTKVRPTAKMYGSGIAYSKTRTKKPAMRDIAG
jgi:hypothetical protein